MGALACRIELDKQKGIVLTVENKDGKITQTAILDGESIVITCQGENDESVITQKPDSISFKCKDFNIDAETITCNSEKDTTHNSKQKFTVNSGKDMSLNSDAKLTVDAFSDITQSSKGKVSICAQTDAELKGLNTSVKADVKTEIKGATLDLSGSAKADLKGPMINITADGMLQISGKLSTIEGKILNLQGTLTKIG